MECSACSLHSKHMGFGYSSSDREGELMRRHECVEAMYHRRFNEGESGYKSRSGFFAPAQRVSASSTIQ
jgi:hypothetical protein